MDEPLFWFLLGVLIGIIVLVLERYFFGDSRP
jgi:hypothetical protein